jgi:hypothetical protein
MKNDTGGSHCAGVSRLRRFIAPGCEPRDCAPDNGFNITDPRRRGSDVHRNSKATAAASTPSRIMDLP